MASITIKTLSSDSIPIPSGSKVVLFNSEETQNLSIKNNAGITSSLTSASDSFVIWEWNGVDLSQFSVQGENHVSFSVDQSGGPDGYPRIVGEATEYGNNTGLLAWLIPNDLTTEQLGNEYEIQAYLGKYNKLAAAKAVFHRIGAVYNNPASAASLQHQNFTTHYQEVVNNESTTDIPPSAGGVVMDSDSEIDKQLIRFQVRVRRDASPAKIYIKTDGTVGSDRWEPGGQSWNATTASVGFAMGHFRSGGEAGDTGWFAKLRIVKI